MKVDFWVWVREITAYLCVDEKKPAEKTREARKIVQGHMTMWSGNELSQVRSP